jgi:hypothetical protein
MEPEEACANIVQLVQAGAVNITAEDFRALALEASSSGEDLPAIAPSSET